MAPQESRGRSKNNVSWLWIILAVLFAAAAIAALWWWKLANPTPAAACEPEKLSLSLGKTERVNNTPYIHVVATNKGTKPCMLEGHPTVSAQGSQTQNFGVSVAQTDPYYPSEVVTVVPGAQAHVAVGVPDAEPFPEGACTEPTTTLRMYLPSPVVTPNLVPITTDFSHKICPGFSVTVFKPGA